MAIAGLIVSAMALAVSLTAALRQLQLARHANVVPVLIDLFREHRSRPLMEARRFVYTELHQCDLSLGLKGLPNEQTRDSVRELMWFYDNLGVMVAYRVVDVEPLAGYLGGSVIDMWSALAPLVHAERGLRTVASEPDRWQLYFEYLASRFEQVPPGKARPSIPHKN